MEQFNRVTLVWKPTGKHVCSKHDKDRNTILAHIQEKKLFDEVAGRTHRSCNIMQWKYCDENQRKEHFEMVKHAPQET